MINSIGYSYSYLLIYAIANISHGISKRNKFTVFYQINQRYMLIKFLKYFPLSIKESIKESISGKIKNTAKYAIWKLDSYNKIHSNNQSGICMLWVVLII